MSNKQTFIPEKLKSLAPTNNAENVDVYLAALEKGIEDESVFNIALSGPYGSGKSSILKTFIKKHENKYRCIEISLASFKDPVSNLSKESPVQTSISEKSKNGTSSSGQIENSSSTINDGNTPSETTKPDHANNDKKEVQDQSHLIEISILQQIFFATDPSLIPQSGLKRIKNADDEEVRRIALVITVGIIGVLLLLKPSFIKIPVELRTFLLQYPILLFGIGLASLTPAIIFGGQWLIKMFLLSKLSAKLNISGAEISWEKNQNLSFLNKHIDQIIYIFESAKYNAVLIEDLDRFNDPEIFTKLREINNLINVALKSKKSSRKVTFIYAIKDDMFVDVQRTKFFELIVPVMPVVDSSNAYDMALREHRSANIADELLNYVTILINEKRSLDNIFNEYYVYKDTHADVLTDMENQIFAIIVYKNMYPEDFAKLHKREGSIHNVFNNTKRNLIDNRAKELQQEVDKLNGEIKEIEKNKNISTQDFVLQFLGAIVSQMQGTFQIWVDEQPVTLPSFTIEHLRKLKKSPNIKISVVQTSQIVNFYQTTISTISFSDVEKVLTPNSSIKVQLKYLDRVFDEKRDELLSKILAIKALIVDIKTTKLKDLLDGNDTLLDSSIKIQSNDLLNFFLRKGYINEMYETVTSRFYPESLTVDDRMFYLNAKNRKEPDFSLQLNHFKKIISKLDTADFGTDSILNNSLIDFLLETNTNEYEAFKRKVFDHLYSRSQHSDSFIMQYLHDNGKYRLKFVIYSCYRSPSFWPYIQTNSLYSNEQKLTILKELLLNVSLEQIQAQNHEGTLSEYIGNQAEFWGLFNQVEHFEKISEIVRILGVKFKTINEVYANGEWFDFICDNNLYELNPTMVNLVLRRKSKARLTDTLLSEANFTCVLNSEYQNLKSYVEDNIDTYVKWVLLADASQQKEETGSLVILLANNAISSQEKAEIIRKQKNRIIEIGQFSEDCWTMLYEEDKVAPIWSNVLKYYDHIRGIDDALTTYLNRQDTFNELAKMPVEFSKAEVISSFTKDFISPNKISNESFENLLVQFEIDGKWIIDLATQNMVKIRALIQHKKLPLTPWVFEQLKTSHSPSHQHVVKQNLSLYFSNPDQYKLEINDYLWLLEANDINDKEKGKIASIIPVEMIQRSRLLGEEIFEMLTETNAQNFTPQVLLAVFLSQTERTKKIKCLGLAKHQFNQDTIFELLRQLDSKFIIPDRNDEGQIIIDNTEENKNITDELKMNEIIDSVKTTKHLIKFKIRDN